MKPWRKILLFVAAILLATTSLPSAPAFARDAMYRAQNDVLYFSECTPSAGGGGESGNSTPGSGSSGGGDCGEQGYAGGGRNSQANKDQIWNYFKSKGLSDVAVAGIMGNIDQESAFMPDANNNNQSANQGMVGGGCRGIVQWCASRNEGLEKFAKERGTDWTCLGTQLDYVWYEVTETGEAGVMQNLNSAQTPSEAGNVWAVEYERMATYEQSGRAERAERIYEEYTGQPVPAPTQTTAQNASNSTSCEGEEPGTQSPTQQGDGITTGEFGSPLDNAAITECWGGDLRGGRGHYAMDWSSVGGNGPGGDVKSVDGGEVTAVSDGKSQPFQGFGNTVVVKHSNGYYSRYSHLDSMDVKVGDKVSKGQKLGVEGNTGASRGTHLDFGISKNPSVPNNSESENPMNFIALPPDAVNQAGCGPTVSV